MEMTNYGRILKMHEKDNPSPFCRASYLISNVGDMIKCYGRMLRFPSDAHIYQKEMELAIGDVIMQCRLIQVENGIKETRPKTMIHIPLESNITVIAENASLLLDILQRKQKFKMHYLHINGHRRTIRTETSEILKCINELCYQLDTNFDTIQHLGFIHTIERFEQFEKDGWN